MPRGVRGDLYGYSVAPAEPVQPRGDQRPAAADTGALRIVEAGAAPAETVQRLPPRDEIGSLARLRHGCGCQEHHRESKNENGSDHRYSPSTGRDRSSAAPERPPNRAALVSPRRRPLFRPQGRQGRQAASVENDLMRTSRLSRYTQHLILIWSNMEGSHVAAIEMECAPSAGHW